MASRKVDAKVLGALILIGIPIFLIVELYQSLGPSLIVGIVVGTAVLFFLIRSYRGRRRQRYLMTKYADPTLVAKIRGRQVWLGQTAEQLRDALQSPVAVDNQQLKTKKREVWKYQPRGVNRYGLRITLENDIVVSWDQKS